MMGLVSSSEMTKRRRIPTAAANDPHIANVIALFPFETDAVNKKGLLFQPLTSLPVVGSPSIASYGTKSALFSTTPATGLVSVNNTSLATTHTIEFWVNTTVATSGHIFSLQNSADTRFYKCQVFSGVLYIQSTHDALFSTVAVADGLNHYIAIVLAVNTMRIYKNGVLAQSIAFNPGFIGSPIHNLGFAIGTNPLYTLTRFVGRLKDFRVTQGVARYSGATMVVPTAPHPLV